jgi:hypothetical protein
VIQKQQDWSVGRKVRSGFLTLIVRSIVETPEGRAVIATSIDGTKIYKVLPHRGTHALTIDEARKMIADHEAATARAFQQADELAATAKVINELFAKAA